MKPLDQLSYILPTVSDIVDRLEPDQLDDPTPCAEFTVRDVLEHMLTLGGAFAFVFRGEQPPDTELPASIGRVPAPEFRSTMEGLLAAAASPGALDRTVSSPAGTMPGEVFARLVAFDGLIHGWDLARATDQNFQPPEAVVAAVDDFARSAITADMRAAGMFAAATTAPAGAGRLEQLVAFSGRAA